MKRYAIIVAGGQGHRMGGEIPKQFIFIKGRPVLFYTLEKFHGIADEIILVLPHAHLDYWQQLCDESDFNPQASVVTGGNSRAESVMNGLMAIPSPGTVAIHDAVRPMVSRDLILRLMQEAEHFGNAVPAIPVRESLRIHHESGSQSVNRDEYVAVQTPQCFDYQLIMDAYKKSGMKNFSDDAGLFELSGGKIHLVPGETQNIKITFREDIAFAEAMMDAIRM